MSEDETKPKGFEQAREKAEKVLADEERTEEILAEAVRKAERNKSALAEIWEDLQILFRMMRAWLRREYRDTPWKTILSAFAGIIYFLNPFDIVPDFLPVAGYLDDATIIGFVIKTIKKDILRFSEWERERAEQDETQTTQP